MKRATPLLQDIEKRHFLAEAVRRESWGMRAWLLQRITGIGIVVFLLAHIVEISVGLWLGEEVFQASLGFFYRNPLFKALDLLVLAGLIFHAVNGIRLILIDLGWLMRRSQAISFGLTCGISAVLFLTLVWRLYIHG